MSDVTLPSDPINPHDYDGDGIDLEPPDPPVTLQYLAEEMKKLARWSRIKNWAILIISAIALVAIIGWLASSRDNSATKRNGEVANCRGIELASDLDEFKIIVSPTATNIEKQAAADNLVKLGRLVARYETCQEKYA